MSDDVLEIHAPSDELVDLSFSGDSTNRPVIDESLIFKIEGLSPTEFPSTEESIRINPKYWISLIRSSKEHQALIGKLQTTCVFSTKIMQHLFDFLFPRFESSTKIPD